MEECKNQILIKLHQLLEFLKPDIYFEVSEREKERERERERESFITWWFKFCISFTICLFAT